MTQLVAQEAGLEPLDTLVDHDALCLFIGEDERPLGGLAGFADWRLCGQLSRLLTRGFFAGARGDKVLLPSEGRFGMERVFAVGVGKRAVLDPPAIAEVLADAAGMLNKAQARAVAIGVPGFGALEDAARVAAFTAKFLPAFQGDRVTVLAEKSVVKLLTR